MGEQKMLKVAVCGDTLVRMHHGAQQIPPGRILCTERAGYAVCCICTGEMVDITSLRGSCPKTTFPCNPAAASTYARPARRF